MLEGLAALAHRRVVLASASPRRLELLRQVGLHHIQVRPSKFEENLDKSRFTAAQYAVETARHKALDVCAAADCEADLVVAADTVVEVDDDILEKPADAAGARRMLQRLSNRSHKVHTGVALALPRSGDAIIRLFSQTTSVWFCELSQADIELYVESGEPFGKAGAYGIQGTAAAFVVRVDGCYNNVVGFPLQAFAAHVSSLVKQQLL